MNPMLARESLSTSLLLLSAFFSGLGGNRKPPRTERVPSEGFEAWSAKPPVPRTSTPWEASGVGLRLRVLGNNGFVSGFGVSGFTVRYS